MGRTQRGQGCACRRQHVLFCPHRRPQPSRPARPLQKNEANERNRAKERDLDQWTRQCVARCFLAPPLTLGQDERRADGEERGQAAVYGAKSTATTLCRPCLGPCGIRQLRCITPASARFARRRPLLRALAPASRSSRSSHARGLHHCFGRGGAGHLVRGATVAGPSLTRTLQIDEANA
jgi:hypothetical protein